MCYRYLMIFRILCWYTVKRGIERQEQETDLQGFVNLAGLTKSIGKDWVYCIPLDTNPQGLKDLIGFKKYS